MASFDDMLSSLPRDALVVNKADKVSGQGAILLLLGQPGHRRIIVWHAREIQANVVELESIPCIISASIQDLLSDKVHLH